ncbi:MAG: bifunctional DNA-formamidopyrimidine glycosylase/DNA-(apurinic or apyrimidinic site) lyase [Thermoanaerobacterales bacterium]|nr:bifunctional DNA-formamidopyrimidine glycosylase/DNA-(apurinic or apyrimidinic site) lyase [Bacillota bacterium]MDI6907533.1 bifunctional DNA-formamidopyrimidine glycosylase/DNA-(apurinic or apyrimidinic site) lyase [Thermoanaerobacterales bacterium]
MPELPEVETIVRGLGRHLPGRSIRNVHLFRESVIARPDPRRFAALLAGRRIEQVTRRGKYILMRLSGGLVLAAHLRMTGQLVYQDESSALPRHTHAVLELDRGILRFTDPRRFGRLWLVPEDELDKVSGLAGLGMEPLDGAFAEPAFRDRLRGRRRGIKSLLLDQRFIAGLGNIYTDEALYRACIHPARAAGDLSARETRALYRAIKDVLAEGINHGGTSVRDYVDASGAEGRFQARLLVYGRKDRPCPRCGRPIARTVCAGRGTYYCPRCQEEEKER